MQLEGDEKVAFLGFMRKMLQWQPEDKAKADDLILDEWLLKDMIKSRAFEESA